MQRWIGAEDWDVILPTETGRITLQRRQGRVDISAPSGRTESLNLVPGPDISRKTAELRVALAAASRKYGSADMSGNYRAKVTVVLLVALLLNVIMLRVVQRYRLAWTLPLEFVLTAGWLLLSSYFVFVRVQLV